MRGARDQTERRVRQRPRQPFTGRGGHERVALAGDNARRLRDCADFRAQVGSRQEQQRIVQGRARGFAAGEELRAQLRHHSTRLLAALHLERDKPL